VKAILIVLVLLVAEPAGAKDVALILNDQDQATLAQLLDGALRTQGLGAASAVYFWQKLKAAPAVTERQDDPPKPSGGADPEKGRDP